MGHPGCVAHAGWGHPHRGGFWGILPQPGPSPPELTLDSICSSISLLFMAAYSFSSLQREGRADVLTVPPQGPPYCLHPRMPATDLFIFLGLYLTW